MSLSPSSSPSRRTFQRPDLRDIADIAGGCNANSTGSEMSSYGVTLLKSFAMLIGRGGAAGGRTIAESAKIDNRRNWERMIEGARNLENHKTPSRVPEARYAYYRRCQQFRRNGEQCKAPAMKGEDICHRHAEQADTERR